jgi:hypothetical protein
MTKVAAAAASSHAFALAAPETWDQSREMNRAGYKRRWGAEPPVNPKIDQETPEVVAKRLEGLQAGFAKVTQALADTAPDVLIIFGDDQHEHFTQWVPQLAIYTGDRLSVRHRGSDGDDLECVCDSALARHLLQECVDQDFDVAEIKEFPEGLMYSHALAQIVHYYHPKMPIIPVWVNGICPPSPSPARCHAFGRAIRNGLNSFPDQRSAFLYGSGGLSHFTAGYPYAEMEHRETYGSIHEDFDRSVVQAVREGRGNDLAKYTSKDFLDHGEIETRQWVTILGAVEDEKPQFVEYEPFYRGIMGMGVALWQLEGA